MRWLNVSVAVKGETRRMSPAHRIHWHAFFVHFPIALFGTAFLFQLLHLFWRPVAFELSTNVTLILASASMVPAVWSGWVSWKKHYRGARGKIFKRKIVIGFVMLFASLVVVAWRSSVGGLAEDPPHLAHVVFFTAATLLITGAVVEGYYGSKLSHRS
jgi:uncharacterized membrane protein